MERDVNSIGKWISVLYRYRKSYASKELEQYGIVGSQFLFLLCIEKNNGASQEKISDCLKLDKTTTAKAIKKLESSGFVERKVDAQDKRAYKLFLTEKASRLIPQIRKTVWDWENAVLSDVSDEEYRQLEELLEKMAGKAFSIGNP